MAPRSDTLAFLGLSAIGFYFMWGVMTLNGGSEAMFNTAETGVFPDGTLLGTEHTGVPLIDGQLNTLIAFFSAVSNLRGVDAGPYLMVLDVTTVIYVINTLVIIESRRRRGFWLRSATLWICLCNCGGTAVWFPLWSLLYLKQRRETSTSYLPRSEAKALGFTVIVGALLESPLVAPAWFDKGPEDIQLGVLFFFLGLPILSLSQTFASLTFSGFSGSKFRSEKSVPGKLAYLIPGLLSSLAHVYSVAHALQSPELSLRRVYVPAHDAVQRDSPNILTEAAHLFLQYDYIVVSFTALLVSISLIHQSRNLNRMPSASSGSVSTLFGITAVFGPGAGLAYAAWRSEVAL